MKYTFTGYVLKLTTTVQRSHCHGHGLNSDSNLQEQTNGQQEGPTGFHSHPRFPWRTTGVSKGFGKDGTARHGPLSLWSTGSSYQI